MRQDKRRANRRHCLGLHLPRQSQTANKRPRNQVLPRLRTFSVSPTAKRSPWWDHDANPESLWQTAKLLFAEIGSLAVPLV